LVRDESPQANATSVDAGVMCEVLVDGHFGYAASSDTSEAGLQLAFARAITTTRASSSRKAHAFQVAQRPPSQGAYRSPRAQGLDASNAQDITQCLLAASAAQVMQRAVPQPIFARFIPERENGQFDDTLADGSPNGDSPRGTSVSSPKVDSAESMGGAPGVKRSYAKGMSVSLALVILYFLSKDLRFNHYY
jgi:hypothetical protein